MFGAKLATEQASADLRHLWDPHLILIAVGQFCVQAVEITGSPDQGHHPSATTVIFAHEFWSRAADQYRLPVPAPCRVGTEKAFSENRSALERNIDRVPKLAHVTAGITMP